MRLSRQFQACLLFLRKDFARTKYVTRKNEPTQQKSANTKQQRQQFFGRAKTSKRVKVVCFRLVLFYSKNLFVNCRDNLIILYY